ncbi:hypothetical protein [Deinococcus sedimenti]|uniref:Membrane protein 6-pyruvoyl-tetrahydropterin synthase-related domain-containing protein n=1 Tax=Deinococcus sedimenti TaxID=1867090 RepID=A0ABQ2S5W7_9DEIO|nr:hypothetical protein [Deinococcus sedimenti]GGR92238.1 hypothetical protein GCM10008960_18850 [Deinococcus sedimenti]
MTLTPPPAARTRPRLLLLALLLTGAYHGVLVLTRAGLKSDQASSLLYLASAYVRAPLDPFDDRWYGGVPLTGHAPLAPQLLALLSGTLGLDGAFAATQFISVLVLLYGTYRFALLLGCGPRGAGVASLLTLLGSALTLSLTVFGQLGLILGAGLALTGTPNLVMWVQRGRRRDLLRWAAALLAAASAHSAAPLLLLAALALSVPGSRQRWAAALIPLVALLLALPDRLWSGPVTRVTPPDLRLGRTVWLTAALPLWSLAWALPAVVRAARFPWAGPGAAPWRGHWTAAPLPVRAALLGAPLLAGALLSLAAPVPWRTPPEALTILAATLLTPLAALVALRAWDDARQTRASLLTLLAAATLVIVSTVSLNALPATRVLEGPPLNLTPLLNFIEKDEHWRYRFLTVGFGRQLGAFSAQTRAGTPAGLWHVPPDLPQPFPAPGAAAALPERRSIPGQGALAALLTHPERAYLKFVYARSDVLDPLLFLHGWHNIGTLENGVNVWEREDIPPVPARVARPALPLPAAAAWGAGPLLSLLLVVTLLPLSGVAWHVQPALPRAVLRGQDLRRVPLSMAALALLLLWASQYRPVWVTQRFVLSETALTPTQGGLRGTYARLDGLQQQLRRGGLTAATARLTARWWTPLGPRVTTRDVTLRLTWRGWQVQGATRSVLNLRREPLSPQPGVTFYRAPRRITTNVTAPADVLDRPVLRVLGGRLVRDARGQVWYVGEVLCADARPGDVTVTVIVRRDGQRLAEENVGLYAQHKVRSGERTPLRVPLRLPEGTDPAALSVEVNARAVVTGRHLERPMVTRSRVQGGRVVVQARNESTVTVATPLALLTLYDARGVSWVYAAVGPELPPGASWPFTLPASPPPGATRLMTVPPPPLTDEATVPPSPVAPGSFPLPGGGAYRVSFVTLPAQERP